MSKKNTTFYTDPTIYDETKSFTPLPEGYKGSVPFNTWNPKFAAWVVYNFPAQKPFQIQLSNHNYINFFLTRSLTPESKELIKSLCGKDTTYPCNTCRDRLMTYLTFFGESGCVFDASAFDLPASVLKYLPGFTGVSFSTVVF